MEFVYQSTDTSVIYKSLIYLAQSRENTYQPIVFLISFVIFFEKKGSTSAYFNEVGKVELDNELLKLWCMKKATMSLFSLITLTGISFMRDVFFGSSFSSSFNFDQRMYIENKNLDYLVLKFYL